MKAYQIVSNTGIDGLKQVDLPDPKPAAGEVLVRVRATSLNYRDLIVVSGSYPLMKNLPLIPVSDGAGEVAAVGDGVTQFKPGDRVANCFFQGWERGSFTKEVHGTALGGMLDGMLSEYVVLHENGLVATPSHLSFEEAATLPCAALTAWHALVTLGNLSAGETVLLLGTGGVSTFGLLISKMHGARAIITSGSDAKLERARQMGADFGINYRTTPDWDEEVRKWTDGMGVDHALEVGGMETFPKTVKSMAVHGRVSIIGGVTGFSGELMFRELLGRVSTIQGISVGSREMFQAMNRAIAQEKAKPAIDKVFPFDEAPDAYRRLKSGGHFGKVVITVE